MKAAFVFPPAWAPWAPSYAMALLKASGRAAGHDVVGFDLNIDFHNTVPENDRGLWQDDQAPFWNDMDRLEPYFERHRPFFEGYARQIVATGTPLVAFSVNSASSNCAILLARLLKTMAPRIYVLFGGPDCFRAERGLAMLDEPAVDAICTGEGDLVWGPFLDAFAVYGPTVDVAGFCYRRGNTVVDRGDPPIATDLDALPEADFSGCDFSRYTLTNRLCMMTSRGCILRCAYCSEGENFLRYRHRSPESLVREVESHMDMLRRASRQRPHINFSDSLINGRPELLERFCDLVAARGIDFSWGGMALLRKEMTRDLLVKMRRAGCVELMWGLESGSAETLRLMRKKLFTPELAEQIIRTGYEVGITQYANIIVGFPGETDEQFEETAAFVTRVAPFFKSIGLPLMEIRRNTHVHENPARYDLTDPARAVDWSAGNGGNTLDIRLRRREVLQGIVRDKLFDQGRYQHAAADSSADGPGGGTLEDKLGAITSFRDFCLGGAVPAEPLEVFFEVSNVCDLKCAMCGEFSAINPHRQEGLRAKKRGFIDEGAILGRFGTVLKRALLVHCFGYGEPTIHPDFRPILDYVARFQVMIDFFTNGMHLDEELCAFLVEKGIYKVTVSFSGLTREVYEAFYIGGDYERVLAGLRRIAELKRVRASRYPIIEINSLAFKQHVDTFESFVEMMAAHGADIIHLKQLQLPQTVPHIHEHVSIMRPWVEGEIVARAVEAGKRLGVIVNADQYLRCGASSEDEYTRRMAEIEAGTRGRLGSRRFGATPLGELAGIAAAVEPRPRNATQAPAARSLTLSEDKATVHALLGTREPSTAKRGANAFHCMEPFKTLYVTRNGGVKPCCFGNPAAWQLGDVGRSAPEEVWNGVGYQAVRDAILASRYPMDLCGHCLDKRLGPEDHFVHDLIRNYLDWHRDRFGPSLPEALARTAPSALNDIAVSRSQRIVARRGLVGQEERMGPLQLPDSVMLDHTVAAVIEGNLERVGEAVIGWVWSPLHPEARLPVSVWCGETLVARVEADIMREDLLRAGKGDGAHGFHILVPMAEDCLTVTVGDNPARLRFHPPSIAVEALMIDGADYLRGQRLPAAELSRILADLGFPRICISFITGRCGSTLLAGMATAYGNFGTGFDALNPAPAPAWKEHNPHRDLAKFVRRFLGEQAMAGGVIYFQITPERWERLAALLPEEFIGMATFSSITRRNILAQAISFAFASTSGYWHDRGDGEYDSNFAPCGDAVEQVREHLAGIRRTEEAIAGFRARHPQLFVGNIFYEDITTDPFSTLAALMTMHRHTVDFTRLTEAITQPAVTRKLRYNAFPDLYRRCLEQIPGLAEVLLRRLGGGPG